jgi:RNA polymerase sigma factor (sigma-70 family)
MATPSEAGSLTADSVLLHSFVTKRDDDAFAALMKRHGAYILSLCRRLTMHAQDAEDVFQACFLELVRKARSVREGNSVVGWLHTVAVRLSRKARTRRQRRIEKEATGAASAPTSVQPEDVSWREACQILEEEIAQLPEDLRVPILLCLFEGHTQEEAGQELNVNPRTIKDRLRRGREQLRSRLVRRGVTLAILGTLLSASTLEAAVPAALQAVTLQGAAAAATNAPLAGIVSSSVLSLTVTTSGWLGWVSAAAVVLTVVLTSGTAYVGWEYWSTPLPAPAPDVPIEKPATPVKVEPPGKVQRSFRNKQFDSEFFQYSGPNPKKWIRHEDEGLRITLPPENGPADAVGVKLRYPVRGDFEVDGTFEYMSVGKPPGPGGPKGWAAGVTFYFFMDSKDRDGLWVGKMTPHDRGPAFCFGQRVRGEGNERLNKFVKVIPKAAETGITRIRAERKGATYSLYAADGDKGELALLQRVDISDANVTILRFAADPVWIPNVPMDVRLVDFAMRADSFVGYAP